MNYLITKIIKNLAAQMRMYVFYFVELKINSDIFYYIILCIISCSISINFLNFVCA